MLTKVEIANKAFEIFRFWSAMAKDFFPQYRFDIIDETHLVQNLLESIQSAQKSLFAKKYTKNRILMGFDEGFIVSYIGSNLNTKWYFDYVVTQSDEYKEFIAFKSLKIYLEFETIANIRISNIYNELIKQGCNLAEINSTLSYTKIQKGSLEDLNTTPNGEILTVLSNQINRFINNYTQSTIPEIMISVERYFTKADIDNIINNKVEF